MITKRVQNKENSLKEFNFFGNEVVTLQDGKRNLFISKTQHTVTLEK